MLIVDDEVEIGVLMSGILAAEGYLVECATSWDQAAHMLEHHQFRTLFLDLNLGSRNGLSLLPLVRRLQGDMQVVVVSAHGGAEVQRRVREEGVDQFILKPFSKSQLLEALKK